MLTTNRVEKGNSATFAPKINARNRQRKPAADAKRTEPAVLVEEPAAPVELEIPAVEVEQPVAVIPQPALIAAPRAAQDAPTATMIRPPTAPIEAPVEPVVATATEPFNEEFSQISDFSISKLISTKFNRGQLSKAEELHLESKQLRNSPGAELIKAPSRPPTPVLPADVPYYFLMQNACSCPAIPNGQRCHADRSVVTADRPAVRFAAGHAAYR